VYTELDENDKAFDEFKAIPDTDEHYVEARLQLAYLYDKQSDYDAAIADLNQALTKKPDDPEIMGYLVGVYQEKKDYPNAIDWAKRMVALQPRNDKYHFTLGALYDEDKQKQLGVEEMHQAISINPSNAPALNYLGYSYAESGTHLEEAERLIKRALIIEPEDGFYVDSLGWVYYRRGEYQKAVDQLERAVNLTGSDPTITEHLGDAYAKVGKGRDAQHQYEDALKKAQDADQIERLKLKIAAPSASEQHARH
jgi:tetratricopeptide (TPR) repeat protein